MAIDFILIEGRYEKIVPFLKAASPSFASSAEYELVSECDDLPGVILASFGRFLVRLTKAGDHSGEIEAAVGAIETLFDWDDGAVQTAIRDEFIESFDGEPDAVRAIRPLLSERLAREFSNILG